MSVADEPAVMVYEHVQRLEVEPELVEAFLSGGWVRESEWQASRPFTEEDVEAAAKAVASRYGHEADAGYRRDARAALDAATARHREGNTP